MSCTLDSVRGLPLPLHIAPYASQFHGLRCPRSVSCPTSLPPFDSVVDISALAHVSLGADPSLLLRGTSSRSSYPRTPSSRIGLCAEGELAASSTGISSLLQRDNLGESFQLSLLTGDLPQQMMVKWQIDGYIS
ncbi:hypothetical protein R1flu_004419 [Riccia fluitans]|uniref:Uncharacterized protein n=1 Tax=Riccia fluitans TaxID=41844 RepID=A0ABD1YQL2_9MARC